MKKNKDLKIFCSIIALCILAIDIILTMIAELRTFCIILIIIFFTSSIALIIYASTKPKKEIKKNVLTNIEDTIIIKLEDLKSEGISPVRNKQEIELLDDESIKKDLQLARENKVTKEILEEELSKTIFINDLKDKMKKYEETIEATKKAEEEQELKEFNKLLKKKKND